MPALELLSAEATAPSSSYSDASFNAGNSNTIRNAANGSAIRMIALWNQHQTAGLIRVRSPFRHDNTNGMEFGAPTDDAYNKLDPMTAPMLQPQEALDVDIQGSGSAGDIEGVGMLIHYENLPGIDARLIGPDELANWFESIMTVQNTLAAGTGGDYTGEEAINAEQDQFKANRDYALIGYQVSATAISVRWRGSDTGNLGVGGPGAANNRHLTQRWFVDLSRQFGVPSIPVFAADNRSGILVDCHQDENGADPTVTSIFALLSPA